MVSWKDDVVIANRLREEIGGLGFIQKLDDLLGTTEVRIGLITHQLPFCDETTGKIARNFKHSDRPRLHIAPDANTDARLEMGIELITLHHIQRDGAMGEEHLARLRINSRRVGLETRHAYQGANHHH